MKAADCDATLEAALAYYFECADGGDPIDEASLIGRFPQHSYELRRFFADQRDLHAKLRRLESNSADANHLQIRCPNCHQPTEVAADSTLIGLKCSACGSQFNLIDDSASTTDYIPPISRMGRFRLVERLGMGAFGTVWKAHDETLDRTVAIKMPRRTGMTGDEQEKFFREARAAAQLRHPNIVSVHEVGRDGDSIYIISDLVHGVTLADWLTGQQLTSREAAELCATIADALEHAHEKGVVHRDLKPGNIMIDAAGKPHLMDFGLARRDAGEVTMTMDGQVLGTPAYMSPEQAEGKAHEADRRSDVYSLGVILFQLLTGELPFRGNVRMILHQVIHDEAPSPRKLNANVKKDLETITLKCLEKDAARRYETARELAAELRRFLRGEPIQARPIGRAERAARWIRRNKTVTALAASVFLALLSGAAVSATFAIHAKHRERDALQAKHEAEQARKDAERRQKQSQAVTEFLVNAFRSPDPSRSGRSITVAEILDRAEKDVESLGDEPLIQAALLQAIGDSRPGLGLWLEALPPIEKAAELRSRELGREHEDTLHSLEARAAALFRLNRRIEAEKIYEEVLAIRQKRLGPRDPLTLATMHQLAYAYRLNGRYGEALDLAKAVYDGRRELFGEHDVKTLDAAIRLGAAYRQTKQLDKAIELQEVVLAARRKQNVSGEPIDSADLAVSYYAAGRYQEAIEVSLETIAAREVKLGRDHPDTHNSMNILASCFLRLGKPGDAIPLLEEIVEGRRKRLGDDDRETINYRVNLGAAYTSAGRIDEAVSVYEAALASAQKNYGIGSRDSCDITRTLLELYPDNDRRVQAVARCEVGFEQLETKLGERHDQIMISRLALGRLFEQAGRPQDAIKLYERQLELDQNHAETLFQLAKVLATCPKQEIRDGKRAVELAMKSYNLTGGAEMVVIEVLVAAYEESGDLNNAIKWAQKGIDSAAEHGTSEQLATFRQKLEEYKTRKKTRALPAQKVTS